MLRNENPLHKGILINELTHLIRITKPEELKQYVRLVKCLDAAVCYTAFKPPLQHYSNEVLAALNLQKREMPRFVWPFLISYLSTSEGAKKLFDYCLQNIERLSQLGAAASFTHHIDDDIELYSSVNL